MMSDGAAREHAGTAHWPRSAADLTDGRRCPACFVQLRSAVCHSCGLDLSHPAAQELFDISTAAAEQLDKRLALIGRIRLETVRARARAEAELADEPGRAETARAEERALSEASSVPASVKTRGPFGAPLAPSPSAPVVDGRRGDSTVAHTSGPSLPAPPPPAPASAPSAPAPAPAEPRRRLSVQVVLLIVGVSLLSVGSIAFLVYAFVNYGIVWRSVIIGAVTVAAFLTAAVLQRRGLRATAEGIAAFAVVLVYLDVWAIRTNNLFGAADADGQVYWGIALLAASAGFIAWHRATGLRMPSVAGFIGFSPGAGVLAAGLTRYTEGLGGFDAAFLVLASVAVAGLVHRLAGRPPAQGLPGHAGTVERSIVLAFSIAALGLAAPVGAFSSFFSFSPVRSHAALFLFVVAAIAATHILVLRSMRRRDWHTFRWTTAFGILAGTSLAAVGAGVSATGAVAFSLGGTEGNGWQFIPPVVAVAVALFFEAVSRRSPDAFARFAARGASWSAAAVAIATLLVPLVTLLVALLTVIEESIGSPWTRPAAAAIATEPFAIEAALALAVTIVLAAVAWRLTGMLQRRTEALGWASAIALVIAVPVLELVWVMLAGWFVLAAAALLLLLRSARTGEGRAVALRRPALGLVGLATASGWILGWASTATWAVAAALAIAVLMVTRLVVQRPVVKSALLGLAAALVIVGAGTAARQITFSGFDQWTDDPVRFGGLAAIALLTVGALVARRLSTLDRRTLFWIGGTVAVAATLSLRFSGAPAAVVLTDPGTGLAADLLLLGAATSWLRASAGSFPVERRVVSVALAPLVWIAVDALLYAVTVNADPAATQIGIVLAPTIAALAVATVSLFAGTREKSARTLRNFRDAGVVAVVAASVVAAIEADTIVTWLVLIAAAASLVVVSLAQRVEAISATLVGAAALLVIGGAAASEWVVAGSLDDVRLAQLAAVLLLLVSAFPLGRVASAFDRGTVFWIALAVTIVTEGIQRVAFGASAISPTAAAESATPVALLLGLLLWITLPANRGARPERIAASIGVGPSVYLVVEAFVAVIDAPDFARAVAPMTAALLTAAGSLTVTLLRPRATVTRTYRELGVILVAAPALLGALTIGEPFSWLVLLFAGITALLSAISPDGLFASRSRRRYLGWLAIGLATAGLWRRLADDAAEGVEAYVLPVAGVLLLVALLTWRAGRRRGATEAMDATSDPATTAGVGIPSSFATPLILLAGLLTGILPIAAYGVTGEPLRAIVVGSVSTALLLLGSALNPARAGRVARPYLDAIALAGAIGVTVTSIGRSAVLLGERPSSGEIDLWILAGTAALLTAAFGLAALPEDQFRRQRLVAGQWLAVIALTGAAVIETIAILRVDAGVIRPFGIVLLFSAVHVLAFLVDRAPFTRATGWLAAGYALVVAAAGIGVGSLSPLELGSVPVALALLATGTVHLDREPEARSWPWLGPGVTLLLLPSLAATLTDRPLWRLVAIGVVGVAIIVIGVLRRLQAPFVISSVLVLVHAVATFLPQIRSTYEAVEWWLWLVIGGIVLISLAARYEQRIRNLRQLGERIGALR